MRGVVKSWRLIYNGAMNNYAFIDGQNLRMSTAYANPPWKVDLRRFKIFLAEKYKASKLYYFIGAYNPQNKKLYRKLEENGYEVIFREHDNTSYGHKKGNVDTDIVFSVMKDLVEQEEFDKVILVSGDGDYMKMVKYLIEKNKFLKLLIPDRRKMSSLYRTKIPDSFEGFLDEESTKQKIAGSP